ncbi:MAG TPA: CRISPR-associated RAMP protein Csx7 [Chloroflexota bacterium]|nr:CRISPR-associated RAMP protein Csx7 [Chloroflexota bacterium]
MTFDRFGGRFTVEGRLRALTALHAGAASGTLPIATDRPVARDALGRPLIPGATLKGALRAEVERVVRAVRPARACNPAGGDAERCVPAAVARPALAAGGTAEARTAALPAETCWVCRLFGAPWLASRVQVADLPVEPETWLGQYQVREGIAVDRDTDTGRRALGYDYEVVPAGVEFACHLRVDTDDPRLLGMLALGLRELEMGRLALGGGRGRGLGRVQLTVTRRALVRRDVDSLLAYLADPTSGAPVDDGTVRDWVSAFLDCLRADTLPEETG